MEVHTDIKFILCTYLTKCAGSLGPLLEIKLKTPHWCLHAEGEIFTVKFKVSF